MAGNTFGKIFRLTTFGESHGPAVGGIIDGMPPRVSVDAGAVAVMMARRRPGASALSTQRNESDEVEILSGMADGLTLGTPIGFIIRNRDYRPTDYREMETAYRPGHADLTYDLKYGIRDHRGGGRASARETAARVFAGAMALEALRPAQISVTAKIVRIGELTSPSETQIAEAIAEAKADNDTLGGIVECKICGIPSGLGEPVFDKLQARLAAAMMSIPAAKGFDYGTGFDGCARRGSELADTITEGPRMPLNIAGGILGGISTGEPITMRVAFKPISTMARPMSTITPDGKPTVLTPRGRHDVTALLRALPVVEAMAAMTILDLFLEQNATFLKK